jgi:hypothetical protein
MARIRSVHPGLASDEAFMSMTMAAKAAWSLLWTECDDKGVFEWKPVVLKARIFPADNIDFAEILSEYEGLDCVKKFIFGGKSYGVVRNFCKFQRPKKPNSVHPLPDELRTYVHLTTGNSEPVGNQYSTSGEKSPQMEDEGCSKEVERKVMSETGSDLPVVSKPKKNKANYSDAFENFWKVYPDTAGTSKLEAWQEWEKLSPDDHGKAVSALPAFREWIKKQSKEYRVVHACRYLSKRRFDGLADTSEPVQQIKQVPVFYDTPEWKAWCQHNGKSLPQTDIRGLDGSIVGRGWYFPTEWPPSVKPDPVALYEKLATFENAKAA